MFCKELFIDFWGEKTCFANYSSLFSTIEAYSWKNLKKKQNWIRRVLFCYKKVFSSHGKPIEAVFMVVFFTFHSLEVQRNMYPKEPIQKKRNKWSRTYPVKLKSSLNSEAIQKETIIVTIKFQVLQWENEKKNSSRGSCSKTTP